MYEIIPMGIGTFVRKKTSYCNYIFYNLKHALKMTHDCIMYKAHTVTNCEENTLTATQKNHTPNSTKEYEINPQET